MDISRIYAITLAAAIFGVLLVKTGRIIGKAFGSTAWRYFVKHVCYPLVLLRRRGTTQLTRLDCLSLLLCIGVNIVCMSVRVEDRQALSKRCANLFALNLVLLYNGGRTNFLVDKILRVLALLPALGVLSALPLRRCFYEIFLKVHTALSLVILIFLWIHVQPAIRLSSLSLLLSSALWTLQILISIAYSLYRNRGWHATAVIVGGSYTYARAKAYWIDLNRPWKAQPGQYVYITVPKTAGNYLGLLQAHPYLIAWTKGGEDEDTSILILVEERRGFSSILDSCINRSTLLHGPFGHAPDLGRYDKVALVASGIGFAGQLLQVRKLLEDRAKTQARVQRISLVWMLDHDDQEYLVRDYIYELVASPGADVLNVLLYQPYVQEDQTAVAPETPGRRIFRFRHSLKVLPWLETEFADLGGDMALSSKSTLPIRANSRPLTKSHRSVLSRPPRGRGARRNIPIQARRSALQFGVPARAYLD
ncbi:MAG: hypothetical protein M1828_001050 [Chrysothrix sp. TS-e1954]|nr:MAG: hypothetical protein M1828_001050 [Chrysothrix sp. TS-e1954]